MFLSREGFLIKGRIVASLKLSGNTPDDNKLLKNKTIYGRITGRDGSSSVFGRGSMDDVLTGLWTLIERR
jgi:hypothetical protein